MTQRFVIGAQRRFCTAVQKADDPKAVQNAQEALILAVADKYEPAIAKVIIAAINASVDAASLKKLADAIESGIPGAAEAAAGLDTFELELNNVGELTENAYAEAGSNLMGALADGSADAGPFKVQVRFDRLNPAAAAEAKAQSYGLIQNISSDTRAAVRTIISRQVAAGLNPAAAAQQIKQVIGLNAVQANALANYRSGLENPAGDAAPMPQDKIDALVEKYRARLIKDRASTIARTESMAAVSAGNAQAWQQAIGASGLNGNDFKRFWIATNDARTRPTHRAIPGMNQNGVGMNQPFAYPGGTIMRPHDPNAPAKETIQCRCTTAVRYVPPGLVDALPVFAGTSILP